ncbi:aminoacyl-tRNA hydrolase [Patescibacteria group bacterium]|jgi:PTH1 family peptidyl-tRNA hydrolase|nr:aminoacyl-tRNA hydrolase [Patescibacteria group bacterium]
MYYILGLGNPGDEYTHTRHNVGTLALDAIHDAGEFSEWRCDKLKKTCVAKGELAGEKATLIFPTTMMNRSGTVLKDLITSEKKAEQLIVLYDDIDRPFGSVKLAFDRGTGGHKGLDSIVRSIKTKKFLRVRIGVTPTTPSGKLKKPQGETAVVDFLLGEFKKRELEQLEDTFSTTTAAVTSVLTEGRAAAMNRFNTGS